MLGQKGMATVEMIPILLLFVLLVNFGLGFFGIIHTGILQSIAARNYAFEVFRNRSNLNYFRDDGGQIAVYNLEGLRFHGILAEDAKSSDRWIASKRPLKFTDVKEPSEPRGSGDHETKIRQQIETQKTSEVFAGEEEGVSPVWVMSRYGICLNPKCQR